MIARRLSKGFGSVGRGKPAFGMAFLWLSLLSFSASAQEPIQGVTGSAVGIGILCPLSGPAYSIGKDFLDGLHTFFNYTNDIGGIHERSIVLLPFDDRGSPDQSVAGVRGMLAEGKVFAIVSVSKGPTIRALIDRGILTDDIPLLACEAPSRSLFSDFRRNIFFLGMPFGDQVVLAVEYLLKSRPTVNPRMALLFQDGFLGEEVAEGFYRASKHYGLEIVGEEKYSPGTYDFVTLIARLWSARADHLVLGATKWETAQIMGAASRLDWFPRFVGPSSTADVAELADAGEGAQDYLVVDYLAKPWERAPGVTLMIGNTLKYYPRKDTKALPRYHVLGYVSGLLVAEALRNAGRDLTREAFIEAFEQIQNLNTHGLAGVIGYNSDSRLSNSKGRVLGFDRESRRFFPLTDWSQPFIKVSSSTE